MKCSVPNCSNSCKNRKGKSFFCFPKNAEVRKKWVKAIGRPDFVPKDSNVICEEHFTEEDIDPLTEVRRLNKGAVPSMNIPCIETDVDPTYLVIQHAGTTMDIIGIIEPSSYINKPQTEGTVIISTDLPLCQAPEDEPTTSNPKRLAAFDFDQTIINDNTDTVVRALLKPRLISQGVQKLAETEGWTKYMQEIFRLLYENGTKPPAIKKAIIEINEVPGMVKCLKTIHKMNFDLIIISDSNSEFIRQWTMTHGLANTFCEIFTNPGWFEDNGLLKIEPYHHQTECKLSAPNLCKGKLLDGFIRKKLESGIKYEEVFYIGDGTNDICPLLRLSAKDYGCPRKDFSMDKLLVKSNICIKANLLRWSTGFELLGQILNVIKKQ